MATRSSRHGNFIPICDEYRRSDEEGQEYVRGHVSADEAKRALHRNSDWDATSIEAITPADIKHVWGRWVFGNNEDFDQVLKVQSHGGRGAFLMSEVTVRPT